MTNTNVFRGTSLVALASAALIAGMPALAQNDTTGSTGGGSTADQMTCAELTRMDTAVVPGTLYFVAGYSRGQQDSMNLTQQVQSGSSGTDTSTTGTDTSTTASGGTDATGTGSATSADSSSATSGTDTGSADTAGTTDTSGGTAQVASLSGYFEIPVESVMTVCGESPDRAVSDVVDEQRGGAGTQSN